MGILGPQLIGLRRAGDGERLVVDDLDGADRVLDLGDVRLHGRRAGRRGLAGGRQVERGQVLGRAEPGVGRRRRVDRHSRADHHSRHRDDDQEQDQELLPPFALEEAPGPAEHGPAGRDPAVLGSGADSVAGRSRTSTLIVREVGEDRFRALERKRLVDDSAVAQEDHAVGPRGELGVVGHHHGGQAPVAGRQDQAHDGFGIGRVERAGGLVGQQELALTDHRPGDGDPLALAPRQLVGVGRRPVLEPEVLQRLERRHLGLAGCDAVELEGQGHVLHRTEPGQQVVVLEDVADGLPAQARLAVARQRRQGPATDVDLTAGGVLEAAGDGQQRALARAAGPHDGHQRSGLDREVDALKGVHLCRPVSVDLRDVAKFEVAHSA